MTSRSRVMIRALGAVILIAGCDSATEPPAATVSLCHVNGGVGSLTQVPLSQLASHLRNGDYVSTLMVSKSNAAINDSIHFTRIGDALAVARAGRLARSEMQSAACRITIAVDTGTYQGTVDGTVASAVDRWPLVIDVPEISLEGAFKMHFDADGVAVGTNDGSGTTALVPVTPLAYDDFSEPLIIVNGHPNGSAGNGTTIEGFVLRSGHAGVDDVAAGQGIFALRVSDLTVAGNLIEGPFSESMDLRASSGAINQNFLDGLGDSCDICFAGPGVYQATGNRLTAGGIDGFLIAPTTLIPVDTLVEQYVLPSTAVVTATITNNDVRNHLPQPAGVGMRVAAIGVASSSVAGTAHVVAHDNVFVNNTFGVIVDAAFPAMGTQRRGDIDLTLGRNSISQSCQHDLLVALSRHTTVLGLTNFPYLQDSHYTIALGGDLLWADAWYGHPAGYGNTLVVNGDTIPNGARSAYDPSKVCDSVSSRRVRGTESRGSLSH